jgi:ABC-type glycerol-3-phosphate transport system substrate-binding protein
MEAMSSGTLAPAMEHLTSEFNRTHKNITVTLEVQASYSTLEAKEQASIAAGNPPTIGQAYEDWAATYAKSGAIVPLASYVHGSNGVSSTYISSMYKGVWKDQFLPGGKLYMWPFNKSDFVMYYNANRLQQQHLAVPTTWTQFMSVTHSLTSSSHGTWGFSMDPGTSSSAANGTYLYVALLRAYGGNLMVNGRVAFASQAGVRAMNVLKTMYDNGSMKLGTNYPGQTALGAEHGAFDLSTIASYYYNNEAIAGKFTMGVAALPKGPAGEGNVLQGTNIVMFSKATSAERSAAWTFMKWLTEPQQTAYWAEHTGYLPVTTQANPLMATYFASHPYQKIAAESLQYALPAPAEPGWTEGIGTIATAIQEVLLQNKPVQQVLTQEQAAAQTYVNQGG